MIDCFFCHRQQLAQVASWIGYGVGTRASDFDTNFKYQSGFGDECDIQFVDNDFEDPNVDRLRTIVDITEPEYVVLPDIFERANIDETLSLGREFAAAGITPIVVPKVDFDFTDIPDGWLLGYSVTSKYGETDLSIEEFTTHDIHLLGGSPSTQLDVADTIVDNDLPLTSVDTNGFARAASFGNIVNYPKAMLDDDANAWLYDVDGYDKWKGRIVVSLAHYYEMWRLWSIKHGY